MTIINSFDNESQAILKASYIHKKAEIKIDTCIITFSRKIIKSLLRENIIEEIKDIKIGNDNGIYPIYLVKGSEIVIYLSPIGAPMTVAFLEEIKVILDIKNIISFGTCGVLEEIEEGKIIVVNKAYRDEGTNYHYKKASDYIDIKNSEKVRRIFDKLSIDYVEGKTWTTDAIYRETENNKNKRLEEGCIAVEMEVSAIQALSDYYNIEYYNFLYSADSLAGDSWNKRILGRFSNDDNLKYFFLALEIERNL
ncbi:MAG: nucleoside phosphorylase [Peptoniphilaceae bacterium]